VLLDLGASIDRAVELTGEAAKGGAELVTFPETFLPGYPEWVWRLRPGADYSLSAEIHRRLAENAVDLEAGGLELVQRAARKNDISVVIGINEREGSYGRSTLYNTDGQIFSDVGVPVALFMENYDINRTGYHDSHDTMANIDLDNGRGAGGNGDRVFRTGRGPALNNSLSWIQDWQAIPLQ